MEEQRTQHRRRMLKTARIAFNDHQSEIDCTVHNLSETGAALNVASPMGIPDRFDLIIGEHGEPRPCQVVWRSAERIGVAFE